MSDPANTTTQAYAERLCVREKKRKKEREREREREAKKRRERHNRLSNVIHGF